MELLLEIIFEIFGAVIESAEDMYDMKRKSRKWKVYIHLISIIKIVFFAFVTGLVFLMSIADEIEGSEHTMVLRVFLFLIAMLLGWYTINSIRKYSVWCKKIKEVVEERKAELKSDNVYDLYDDEANKEWLKSYYGEGYEEYEKNK